MKVNALAVANYFVDLAHASGKPITLLGLVKKVYIAHGFSLALFGKSLLDERFDTVEAWKYGPVIPSVYHSFKQYKANPIPREGKAVVVEWNDDTRVPDFVTPELTDADARKVVEMVARRYAGYTDSDLVTLTHQNGTPWEMCYKEGVNEKIPDLYTRYYYQKLVKVIEQRMKEQGHE